MKKQNIAEQVAVLSRRIAELEATHTSLGDRNKCLERLNELKDLKGGDIVKVPAHIHLHR